jgi:hypothetical protein
MAKKIVYIVCKIGWEYNDETYYRPESEGGTPVLAYSTKEKAQAECDKRNAHLKNNKGEDGYITEALDNEVEVDEYGCIPITADYEVVPVNLED